MRTEAARRRCVGLDLLKALAAAGIVLHHYQQMAGVGFSGVNFFVAPDLFQTEYVFGWLTILFFMISGFLAAAGGLVLAAGRRWTVDDLQQSVADF